MELDAYKKESVKYSKKEYWEERFEKEQNYEWLCGLSAFEHTITPFLKQTDKLVCLILFINLSGSRLFELWKTNLPYPRNSFMITRSLVNQFTSFLL